MLSYLVSRFLRSSIYENWYNYRHDVLMPTHPVLAAYFAARDLLILDPLRRVRSTRLFFNRWGAARWFKPSNFDNPISRSLNASLFDPINLEPRDLTLRERILLALGF